METEEELAQASEGESIFNPDISSEAESEFDNGFDKL
jgi:hypothetical protein